MFNSRVMFAARTAKSRALLVALGSVAAIATHAGAELTAYNAIGPVTNSLYFGNGEVAEDMLLDPAAGLMISKVTVRAREGTSNNTYSGTLRVAVYYADAGGAPGALLTSLQLPVTLSPPSQFMDIVFDVPDVLAPSTSIWTSWYFGFPGSTDGLPSVGMGFAPTVGTTGAGCMVRTGGVGAWSSRVYDNFAMRVETVPSPGAVGLLGMMGLVVIRRRRGR